MKPEVFVVPALVVAVFTAVPAHVRAQAAPVYTAAQAEAGAEATKALMGAKTVKEAVDLQSDYARKRFDKIVAEGTRISEMAVQVGSQAFEPIQDQFTKTVEKALKTQTF